MGSDYDAVLNEIRQLKRREYFFLHKQWNMALYSYGEIRKYMDYNDTITFKSSNQYITRDTDNIGKQFLSYRSRASG